MNKEYFRITCEGIGIYEYLKNYLWNNISNPSEVWDDFIKSNKTNWLNKPTIYTDEAKEYRSYFNVNGYEIFLEKTLPLITEWIDKNFIKIEKVMIDDDKIVYQDEYQIVIGFDKIEKSREFCSKVKELAKQYNLSFFVVTEGASAISNNGCEAVKHARDCHIEWEKQHNFDPFEDWSKDKGDV